jgi:uncharacterized protein (TIGR02246 family)
MALVAVAFPAAAQEKTGTSGAQGTPSADDPMAGWVARKVTNEAASRKEIQAYFKAMDQASRKGDLEAAADLIDFPVLMVTDSSKGEVKAGAFSKEEWTQMMGPFYEKPMPKEIQMTHKPTVTVLTDSLATVVDDWTMTMKGKKVAGKSAMHLVKVDGKWRAKSMVEGGWGDAMGSAGGASGASGSAGSGTSGSGMSGSGTSGPSGSSGSGTTSQPGSQGQRETK